MWHGRTPLGWTHSARSSQGEEATTHARANHPEVACDRNAHPHVSNSGQLAIIHNGIIENYASLKKQLEQRGYTFESDTDTEVLMNLIEDIQKAENRSTEEAVRVALNEVIGAYAIVVIDKNKPDTLIAARKGSPLVIGIGKDEFFVASDASPIIEYTKKVVYLMNVKFILCVTLYRFLNIERQTSVLYIIFKYTCFT